MTQMKRRIALTQRLLAEQPRYRTISIPREETEQRQLLRSLMNVRSPREISEDFLAIQDAYLQEDLVRRGITDIADLSPLADGLYLWQGDITSLRCDAIVNAANSGMTGCYIPCHRCIDNCIHTRAGMQLRLECAALMREQGHEEETGKAKITGGWNLPCRYVLHTVGPVISGPVTDQDEQLLASCYRSCLELAERHGVQSIAFCCISTGEFHFPHDRAAKTAVQTVRQYRERTHSAMKVIFNVFRDVDYELYQTLLTAD